MISAFGCPFRCAFCDLNTKLFRQRSAKHFVDEIEIAYREFGVRDIDIHDSLFTVNKQRIIEITDDIKRRKLDVHFTVRTRVDCVNEDILRRLKQAGCTTLMYGIESGDPEVLKTLHKGIQLDRVRKVVDLTRHYKMKSLGFFMVGSPGDTVQTVSKTIQFAKSLDLDYIRFTRVTAVPNTELYRMFMQDYQHDYWSDYTRNPDLVGDLPLVRTNITEDMAYKFIKHAYVSYYFRPKQLYRSIINLRSGMEFKNLIKAGVGLLRA